MTITQREGSDEWLARQTVHKTNISTAVRIGFQPSNKQPWFCPWTLNDRCGRISGPFWAHGFGNSRFSISPMVMDISCGGCQLMRCARCETATWQPVSPPSLGPIPSYLQESRHAKSQIIENQFIGHLTLPKHLGPKICYVKEETDAQARPTITIISNLMNQ